MTAHKSATQPEAVQDERLLSRHNLQAAALLAVLIAANYVVFRKVFNTNYFRWYVDNGTILALVLATAAVGLNLDAEDGLISSRPYRYFLSWMQIVANLSLQLSAVMVGRRQRGAGSAEQRGAAPAGPRWRRTASDVPGFLAFLLLVCLTRTGLILAGVLLAIIAWIAVVAPLQYFLYLFCGAPARTFKGTVWTDEALPKGSLGFVEHIPATGEHTVPAPGEGSAESEAATEAVQKDQAGTPHLWQTVYSARPVAFTTSVAAVALWIIGQLL